jgi:hypothetical protein
MIPDRDQPDVPDPSLPSITGRYQYYPLAGGVTSAAHGCRCIKDPLYEVNNYNFLPNSLIMRWNTGKD